MKSDIVPAYYYRYCHLKVDCFGNEENRNVVLRVYFSIYVILLILISIYIRMTGNFVGGNNRLSSLLHAHNFSTEMAGTIFLYSIGTSERTPAE